MKKRMKEWMKQRGCEYRILFNQTEYTLYRKLKEREEDYYTEEQDRLKSVNGGLWLCLQSSDNREVLETLKSRLEKSCL